jgi:hypothetical protein
MKTIFIQTASFNEKEIYNTVHSAYKNAEFPERIYFGLYDQRTDQTFKDLSSIENVTHVKVNCTFARGIGVARLNSMTLHQDQDYCLQIDAHTIFDKNWDSKLINDYNNLKNITEKPIISYRAKFWQRDKNNNIVFFENSKGKPLVVDENDNHYYMKNLAEQNTYPIEHYLSSGHFVFTELNHFNDFMPDPNVAFGGEEHLLALRACTRGYRIFVTENPHLWHMGRTTEDRLDENFWSSHILQARNKDLNFNLLISDKNSRINKILKGEILGYYGAPNLESYENYIINLGFNYKTGKKLIR